MFRKFLATLALILPISLGATACAGEPAELSADTVIIDVRTPAEFASGHLEGALNIGV